MPGARRWPRTQSPEPTARFEARLPREKKDLLQRAAVLRGDSLSDFVLQSAEREAERVLLAHSVITLGEHDSRAFAEALRNPPAPSTRMRVAAQQHFASLDE